MKSLILLLPSFAHAICPEPDYDDSVMWISCGENECNIEVGCLLPRIKENQKELQFMFLLVP